MTHANQEHYVYIQSNFDLQTIGAVLLAFFNANTEQIASVHYQKKSYSNYDASQPPAICTSALFISWKNKWIFYHYEYELTYTSSVSFYSFSYRSNHKSYMKWSRLKKSDTLTLRTWLFIIIMTANAFQQFDHTFSAFIKIFVSTFQRVSHLNRNKNLFTWNFAGAQLTVCCHKALSKQKKSSQFLLQSIFSPTKF